MQGPSKCYSVSQDVALKLNLTEDEFAMEAGNVFFPQQHRAAGSIELPSQEEIATVPMDNLMNSPFSMGELLSALQRSKKDSAPGPDGITYAALRNLTERHKQELLEWINEIWEKSELPEDWRESWVVPVPKSGKPANQLGNLRPISLTSNVCKVMERMVLGRI